MTKVDWSKAPEGYDYALTTGPEWSGSESLVEVVEFAKKNTVGGFSGEHDDCYFMDDTGWILLEERPNKTTSDGTYSTNTHYQNMAWRASVSQNDADNGYVDLTVDPYRVSQICGITESALDQCLKKTMRHTTKGHSLREVYEEIISAAQRGLDMLDEDGVE